jgi:transposase
MTIQLEFSPDTLLILNDERYSHPVPIVQRRMEALWLKSHNLPHAQIAKLVGVCENTLRDYFKLYQEGGVENLRTVHFHRPISELNTHITSLEAHFKEHPPATINKAQNDIETLTGIKRSRTQVRTFLKKKLGMRCRKIGMIPAKADPDKQAEYLEKTIEPRLNEARAGQRAVFFVDAAHFVLAPFLGFLWSVARLFIRAPSGRQRFNVLGALNAITHELISITNDTYITSTQVCELLEKLADSYVGIPITLFLDNARYQKCALVIATAARLQIELCFLPPYSPNLNLIERLWRFVKKKCLYSTYYPSFDPFKAAITDCLNQTHSKYKSDLDTLLTLRFQLFEKAQIMTV